MLFVRRCLAGALALCLCAGGLTACASASAPPIEKKGLDIDRFTRVNMRPGGEAIGSSAFFALPMTLPLGSPAKIKEYTATVIRLKIAGEDYSFYPHPPHEQFPVDDPGVDAFLKKYFVDRKEDARIDGLGPAELRDKVAAGIPMQGMTKEQIYACLGPPLRIGDGKATVPLTYEQIIASDTWLYPWDTVWTYPRTTTLFFGQNVLQKMDGPHMFAW